MCRNTTPLSGNMRGNDWRRSVLKWWRIPLSGARDRALVSSMETVFFRIDIKSISGLRAIPEAEEPVHQ
jgi:hypothetical protein